MPTFALSKLDGLDSLPHIQIPIYKLEANGHCEYDEWRAQIQAEGTYADELRTLDTLILEHAQMKRLAPNKFKELSRNKKDSIKDYEFRSRNLRIYLFKLPTGKVIVLGGHNDKKDQKQEIKRMRGIKEEYYKSLLK